MKRLHVAFLGILAIASLMMPTSGCPRDMNLESTTGAACSIKDLNNLYKTDTVKAKVNTTDRVDRNLRPVSIPDDTDASSIYSLDCQLGVCIPRLKLEK